MKEEEGERERAQGGVIEEEREREKVEGVLSVMVIVEEIEFDERAVCVSLRINDIVLVQLWVISKADWVL